MGLKQATAGNLIVNGDFASPAVLSDWEWEDIPNGSSAVTGWVVGGGGVDAYAPGYIQSPEGARTQIRLYATGPGSITQMVKTTPGTTYILQFFGAGEPKNIPLVKVMQVIWDNKVVASPHFSTVGYTLSRMGWSRETLKLTATSTTSVLEFADATPGGHYFTTMVAEVSLRAQ